jgi:hypothetical protein
MIQKIKSRMLFMAAAMTLFTPTLMTATLGSAFAANSVCSGNSIGDSISSGANGAASGTITDDCTTNSGVGSSSLATVGHDVVNIFSLIVGIIAIIMIIVGGFRYITSGGSSDKVGGAKNTLVYAIIGLIIVALAQIIVHFVLNQTNNAVT